MLASTYHCRQALSDVHGGARWLHAVPCSSRRVLGHSVYFAVKWRPARDSLIRRITSLMARFNSLLGRNKFPVPMRRELRRKPLNLMLDCEPVSALAGPDEQNSLYFPS